MTGGGLQLTNGTTSVASVTLGTADDASDLKFRFARGSSLAVTETFSQEGSSPVAVRIYETAGVAAELTTGGTYPLISAPREQRAALEAFASRATLASPAVPAVFAVVEADGRAVLQVTATFPESVPQTADVWSNESADGLWATGGNWASGEAVDAAGRTATFPDLGSGAQTVTLGAGETFTAGGLDFTASATDYTVTGGALALANGADGAAVSSVGGRRHTVASTLSGAVKVNPAAKGAGEVTLAGIGRDFAGTLTTGSGTTVLDALDWVTAAEQLVLGPGTLKYTGPDVTIPGFRLNAGANRAAVLDLMHDVTVSTMSLGTSAFMKTGPGALRFGGTESFTLANTSQNAAAKAGIGVYGDSPVDAVQQVTVAEGALVLGALDDPLSAPVVNAGNELDIGGRTASAANGRREVAGAVEVNSGVLSANLIELGYYNGTATTVGDAPEERLTPRFTLNGGTVDVTNDFSTLWDWGFEHHNNEALIEIHGGRLNAGRFRLNCMQGGDDLRTVWNQDGGVATAGSMFVGMYARSGRTAPSLVINLDGGEFRVNGTCTFSNAVPTDIYVNTGAVFQSGTIQSYGVSTLATRIHFRGGRYDGYVPATGNTEWRNQSSYAVYLADDLVFDTAADRGLGNMRRFWTCVNHRIDVEPGSERTDYGITVVGGGQVAFGAPFADSTFTGPVRAMDGSSIVPLTTGLSTRDVVIDPGSILRQYNLYASVRNLTLGAAGATKPAYVDLHTSYAKTNGAIVVSGDLAIAGPVAFITHSDNNLAEMQNAAGVYTALVYRAEQTLDLSKFTTAQCPLAKTASFREVTIPASAKQHAGMKALVVTLSGTSAGWTAPDSARAWSAVSTGGAWSGSANWSDNPAPDGAGSRASFRAATARGVPVTLDTSVTVGHIDFAPGMGANGYTFTGAPLTLDCPADASSDVWVYSGTNVFAGTLVVPGRTMFQVGQGARLQIDDLVSSNQTIVVNNFATTGGGEVQIMKHSGITTLFAGSGRTIVDDLSFAATATGVQICGGSLDYYGTGETIAGIYLPNAGNRCSVLRVEKDLAIKSMSGTKNAITKTGPGDLVLRGNGSFVLGYVAVNRSSQADTYVRSNGDGPKATFRRGNVSEGRIVQGTVDDPADAPNVTCSDFCCGMDSVEGKNCEYVLNNGVLNTTGAMYIDYYHGVTKKCRGKFTMNGGTLTASWIRLMQSGSGTMHADPEIEINGGTASVISDVIMGYQVMKTAGNTATLRVNGGRLTLGGVLYGAYYSDTSTDVAKKTTDGVIDVNGGELFCAKGVVMCRAAANTATLRLNGGVLAAQNVTTTRGTSRFYFNGGEYRPLCAGTLSGLTSAYVSTNGAVISTRLTTNGAYVVAQNLLTDPALNGVPDGGFVKDGKGMLVLSGANTFTGPTKILFGTLQATRDEALSDRVEIANAGVLDMAGRTLGVGEILMRGLAQNGVLSIGGALLKNAADDSVLNVSGDLTVAPTAVVDFGLDVDDGLAFGRRIPLAVVSGTVTAPARLKTRDAGRVPSVQLEVKDGLLWATTISGGTLFVIR